MTGEIEDETHFVLDCHMYENLRETMLEQLQRTLTKQQKTQLNQQPSIEIGRERKDEEGRKKLMAGLVGDLFPADEALKRAVLVFCKRAMKRRNRLVRTALDQMT